MSVPDQPMNAEPTMDEILASIRSMLKDDHPSAVASGDDLSGNEPQIDLDVSMVDGSGVERTGESARPASYELFGTMATTHTETLSSGKDSNVSTDSSAKTDHDSDYPSDSGFSPPTEHERQMIQSQEVSRHSLSDEGIQSPESIVGEQAARESGRLLGTLVNSLARQRNVAVSRGGPLLEDIVREELRPLLKAWLDSNLPGLVERLVRAEIERLIERVDH